MRIFLNAIISYPHPEEAQSAVSKDAYFVMQHLFQTLWRFLQPLAAGPDPIAIDPPARRVDQRDIGGGCRRSRRRCATPLPRPFRRPARFC